ncbi:MAG TPA: gas vesicle protein [Terriglobales bacterium]|nr:gas vesicle protein [Terriglobales bacterium]
MERVPTVSGTTNLLDILDRVLDKGLVIAGDIRVSLANVELLTIRVRLLVCSVDKAEQIGLNWWKYDPHLTLPAPTVPAAVPEGVGRPPRPSRRAAVARRRR